MNRGLVMFFVEGHGACVHIKTGVAHRHGSVSLVISCQSTYIAREKTPPAHSPFCFLALLLQRLAPFYFLALLIQSLYSISSHERMLEPRDFQLVSRASPFFSTVAIVSIGSKNMSYDSASLTTPDIKWLGVRPSDLDR